MSKPFISREELLDLLASCNNCLMRGSYSGDDLLDAAQLMLRLVELHDEVASEAD